MKITFKNLATNATQEFFEGRPSLFPIQNLSGIGQPETEESSERAPFVDGQLYLESIFVERSIVFGTTIRAENESELRQKRQDFMKILNAKDGLGELQFEFSDGTVFYLFNVAVTKIDFLQGRENRAYTYQNVAINFTAYDPYFYGEEKTIVLNDDILGGKTFPKTYPFVYGQYGNIIAITNEGQVATPFVATFKGQSTNASLTNQTTNQKIQVDTTLLSDDVLEVNGITKKVEKNGESAFNDLTIDSEFFDLQPGLNEILYNSGLNSLDPEVEITYRERYLAI